MLHLIAFEDSDSPLARQCLALYRDGDVCVFADGGALVAADFPLRGPGYLLEGGAPAARPAALETIDHARFVDLMAEHGPVTSWYP
ncbi:hypothetical protein [Alloalcanivorax profundimaris]|uniref:hypothetical protein n=1 Tax=Alloalcanivorax profundimaris TaxID=2735259 RepID=UPI001887360E|nr:hypothetical protein [Alloalcanivorax profundimaris]MBF1801426.1 hypothetical protein [Alloalcanivorax profundimaris]MCQ6261686.1 hypothetical protein [Alcanivorax sp. MM125-6]